MRARTSASHACGSTPFIFAETMRLYMAAAAGLRDRTRRITRFPPERHAAQPAFRGIVNGYDARDAPFPTGVHGPRKS